MAAAVDALAIPAFVDLVLGRDFVAGFVGFGFVEEDRYLDWTCLTPKALRHSC